MRPLHLTLPDSHAQPERRVCRQPVEQWKAPALSAEAAAPAHEPTPESIKARRYDLVLFGATGFTGQLAAKYLAQCEAAKGIRWAIAGRRIKALEALRAELVEVDPTLQVSIIVADSSQADTLKRLVENTKVRAPLSAIYRQSARWCASTRTSTAHCTWRCNKSRTVPRSVSSPPRDRSPNTARRSCSCAPHVSDTPCTGWGHADGVPAPA